MSGWNIRFRILASAVQVLQSLARRTTCFTEAVLHHRHPRLGTPQFLSSAGAPGRRPLGNGDSCCCHHVLCIGCVPGSLPTKHIFHVKTSFGVCVSPPGQVRPKRLQGSKGLLESYTAPSRWRLGHLMETRAGRCFVWVCPCSLEDSQEPQGRQ